MTESTCLHIQDCESGPIRVVELPWISVRIGRAAYCEVRLAQPNLPEEIFRLQRRGLSWRLLPAGVDCPVFLNGQRLGGACVLPFDLPFRVGPYCFTLRQDRSAQPDWQVYAQPAPLREAAADAAGKPPIAELESDPPAVSQRMPPLKTTYRQITTESLIANPASLHPAAVELPIADKRHQLARHNSTAPASYEQWETRWNALSARVSARAGNRHKAPDFSRPSYRSDLEPIALRQACAPPIEVPANPNPFQESQPERTVLRQNLPASISAPEAVDHEQQVVDFSTELLEEPPPASPVDVLLERQVEDALPKLDPITIKQYPSPITEPEVEPQSAIECSDDQPFILNEQMVSIPSAPFYREDLEPRLPRRHEAPAPTKNLEWPSAKDILAAHQAARPRQPLTSTSKNTTKNINRSSFMPTLERQPSHWAPPLAVTGPVAVIFVIAAGILGCSLSWSWAQDSYSASIVTDRLFASDRTVQRNPLPDSVQPPAGSWLTSTSAHLATWAIFLSHSVAEENQPPEETTALLQRALTASPINAQARLAQALLEPIDGRKPMPSRIVGLSRDAASLAWSAHQLVAVGKKDDALTLFGRALSLAVPEKSSRHRLLQFSEDPTVPRYLLPGEEPVREIVADFISQNVWTFEEWSRVLPESPLVLVAVARLLHERGCSEAETVLDRILKQTAIPLSRGEAGPVAFAACAEALALRSRFKESYQLYRQAIDSIDDPTIRRSWWFNLADIAYRSDDDIQRQAALRSASAVAFSDDITRRVTDIQRATLTRSTGVKAN
jgi:hypothetical protein